MKKIILVIISVCISILLFPQQEPIQQLNIKSPEVSAFEKYGEIPVNTYAGIPEISIPLYKIRSGDAELPISLDYHATAIKVDQEATWVGLNWLMNVGGVISTEITRSYTSREQWGKLFNQMIYADTRSSDFEMTGRMVKFAGTHEMYSSSLYGRKLFAVVPDSQYDSDISGSSYMELAKNGLGGAKIYHANFLGYSFSFIYHPVLEKYIIVGKDNKFVIETTSGGDSPYFTLIAPNGFKYSFSNMETTTYAGGTPARLNPFILSSYYLSEIVSPTGGTIYLRYKQYGFTYPIIKATETVHYGYKTLWGMNLTDGQYMDGEVCRKLASEYYTDNKYLCEIESDDALVKFQVGDRLDMKGKPKKLDRIEIYDKSSNKQIKCFSFQYDYYQGCDVGGDYIYDYYRQLFEGRTFDNSVLKFTEDHLKKRLRLLSLQEDGFDNNGNKKTSAPYQFTYDMTPLPGKTSAAHDYWGNYNGIDNSGGKYYHILLPDVTNLGEDTQSGFPNDFKNKFPKADQRLNPSSINAGLLSRITYPTGGYSTFLFEPHRISNFPKSTYSSGENWPITKTVQYWKSNYDKSLPLDFLTAKEFKIKEKTNVTLSAEFRKTASYTWDEFEGATAILFKYNLVRTSDGSVMEYPAVPIKIFSYSNILSELLPSIDSKIWEESISLEPGSYRLHIYCPWSQISAYDMTFKGRCHLNIMVSANNSKEDLLSEYKLGSFFTQDTDSDLKYDPKELTPKEFILTEETGLKCNLSITTAGKYSWNRMEGSKAILYKYPNTRLEDGSVSGSEVVYKQWDLKDFVSTTDSTKKIKNDTILLPPGRYRIEAKYSIANIHPSSPEAYGPKAYIELSVSQYQGNISSEVSADALGVRIAQIKSYDGKIERTTKYKYSNLSLPSGLMMNPLKFTRKRYQIFQGDTQTSSCDGPKDAKLINYWLYSSNNQIPQANNDVGYSYVEVITDGIGYETFTYWNQRNYSKDYLKPLPDPRNGNLLEHCVYNSSGQLIKTYKNKYTILKTEPYFVNAVIEDIYLGGDSPSVCSGLVNPYSLACPYNRVLIQIYPSIKTWMVKSQSIEESYFPLGKIIDESNYIYNPSNLELARIEKKINDNEIQKRYFIYPVDYSTTGYPANLISRNIITYPTEVVNTLKKENGEFVLDGTLNYYTNNGKKTSISNLEFTEDLSISNFRFSNKTANGNSVENNGIYSPFSQYTMRMTASYGTKGNILNTVKDKSLNFIYLWGYNGQYPIAEIKNITYDQIKSVLTEDVINRLSTSPEPLVADLKKVNDLRSNISLGNIMVTTYTYKPLVGMTSMTAPSGLTTYYEYDDFGRLKRTYIKEKDGNGSEVEKNIQSYNYHYRNQ